MAPTARQDGLALLARRDLTAAELSARLGRKSHSPEEISAAIDDLLAAGAIDERRVAEVVVRAALRRHHGRARALQALAQRGIPSPLAREVVADAFDPLDEESLVDAVLARRLRDDSADPRVVRRVHGQLVRLGYSSGAIAAAFRRRGLWPVR